MLLGMVGSLNRRPVQSFESRVFDILGAPKGWPAALFITPPNWWSTTNSIHSSKRGWTRLLQFKYPVAQVFDR
jgi:hypothetical protein